MRKVEAKEYRLTSDLQETNIKFFLSGLAPCYLTRLKLHLIHKHVFAINKTLMPSSAC